jgi:hypothetical protein
MWFLYILVVLVVVFGLLYWSGKRFNPEKMARGTAKMMLAGYRSLEANFPDWTKEKLFTTVIEARPTFRDPNAIDAVLESARHMATKIGQPLRLWMVALSVVIHEYESYRQKVRSVPGDIPSALDFQERFRIGILAVIPDDL